MSSSLSLSFTGAANAEASQAESSTASDAPAPSAALDAAMQLAGLSAPLDAPPARVPGFTGLVSAQDAFAYNLTRSRALWAAAAVIPEVSC